MKILKRDGSYQSLSFDKILYRLRNLCEDEKLGKLNRVEYDVIAQKVVGSMYDGVSSSELDEEAARIAIGITDNLEYGKIASRITISNMHKSTTGMFCMVMEDLYSNVDKNGKHAPIISDKFIENVRKFSSVLEAAIDYSRDYLFDYHGYKRLEKGYLMKIYNKKLNKFEIVERPQHLYMRVAVGIHLDDIDSILKTYNYISQHYYTHASPTLFNAGSILNNLSSCYLLGSNDNLEGIFKTITDCAKISKVGGGIGVHISNIRGKGSLIRKTNGVSDGIVPMLKVYNSTANYINQSGKRKGSFAIYLEPHHPDIFEFLELKKNQGHDDVRARDLFYAIWVSDLFMKKVENDEDWALMCPDECPGLSDCYGEEYEKLYNKYYRDKKYKRIVKAREIWQNILDLQIETGIPYIGYKDAVNRKSNQKNLGTTKSSNLCMEISLYSDHEMYQVCNLLSFALPKYVENDSDGKPFFNYHKLAEIAEYTIGPMNCVIDNNYYPVPETAKGNFSLRPLGLGVQGLHDVYFKLGLSYDSPEAERVNKEIFEALYYGCIKGSINEAKKHGSYPLYDGSPFSEGKLQFDLAQEFDGINLDDYLSDRWDWNSLKSDLLTFGIRNSMLVALMPTATTAQILNNSDCFEPIDSNIYKKRTLSGDQLIMNKYLVNDLDKLGLWSKEMKDLILLHKGSIQQIDIIPQHIKDIYKTCWEISMKAVIRQAADRGVFVDQMQSMNLFMSNPTISKLTSAHFFSWKNNLKTGMYYLRSQSSASAANFGIDASLEKSLREKLESGTTLTHEEEVLMCSLENKEACEMCTS